MINPQALADELNRLLATETHSLARHLEESTPYVTPANFRVWRDLQPLAAQSREHAERLSALLSALELPERPIPFSPDVARFHFTAFEVLLPQLIEEKQRQVNAYRRALDHAQGNELVESELQSLLDQCEGQLEEINEAQGAVAGV